MTRLVLGSASAGRLSVLRRAGVDPVVVVSDVDEDAVVASLPGAPPAEVVLALSAAKADRVAAVLEADIGTDCVVVGCDSMLELDGRLRGKPGSVDAARAQWRSMAGRPGILHTGHTVLRLRDGVVVARAGETAHTTVHFAKPEPPDLEAYLASGEPLWVAGGFTLDGLGGWFVDRIEGDPSNVIGLSLPLLRRLLADLGVGLSPIWRPNPIG
ncbi:Maf-like protein [Mycolicibacterium canariasense]|uniref:Nucleoside triphosphate pyrophosphatase n=1 Tax=Mycolicibacterium canariasense TaxID=228230 RepID=A0A100WIW1_MYCCR|nr:nucleoside triphosphate pyrophosphatase [Mycolicibacterium canariasense]MCV7208244.1 septum formation inhibitor Maf [Mycolicibacterium canariasense]ORV09425.1 septum formation inhibitor Maf [Mycolicibacterium canariasense]GAS99011.1 Maf-like protein [Mycolicibacterium canariasense]